MTRIYGFQSDTIDHVTDALGDFAADFDIKAIAAECFDWDPKSDQYRLTVDDKTFWTIVQAHEIGA